MTGLPFFPPAVARNPGPPQAWLPRPYSQLLRGPTYRWWRPLLSVLVMLVAVGVALVVSELVLGALITTGSIKGGIDGRVSDSDFTAWSITTTGLALTNWCSPR